MSIKKVFLVIGLGIFVALASVHLYTTNSKTSKEKMLKLAINQKYLSGKTRSSIYIDLSPSKNYDGDLAKIPLIAKFRTSKEFYNLKYKWNFPENIKVQQATSGDIGQVIPGQELSISADFINEYPDKNARISIEIYSEEDSYKIGNVAHYNSLYYEEKKLRAQEKQKKLQLMRETSPSYKIHE